MASTPRGLRLLGDLRRAASAFLVVLGAVVAGPAPWGSPPPASPST